MGTQLSVVALMQCQPRLPGAARGTSAARLPVGLRQLWEHAARGWGCRGVTGVRRRLDLEASASK